MPALLGFPVLSHKLLVSPCVEPLPAAVVSDSPESETGVGAAGNGKKSHHIAEPLFQGGGALTLAIPPGDDSLHEQRGHLTSFKLMRD
jgi:hypothetical protein